MSSTEIVIIGCGGSGREVLGLLRDISEHGREDLSFIGFMSNVAPDYKLLDELNAPFVGSPDDDEAISQLNPDCEYVVAIGGGDARARYRRQFNKRGLREHTLIHPSAILGEGVEVASGVICAGTIITTNVKLGYSAQVNVACTISHDVSIGDDVTLSPGVTISGHVEIGSRATVYAGATVIPHVRIGEGAVVGAGAGVIRDVPVGATVVGNPARQVGETQALRTNIHR